MSICKLCHSYDISILKAKDSFTYKGQEIEFEVEYSVCNSCQREFIDSQQIQKNDATILNAKIKSLRMVCCHPKKYKKLEKI